MRRAGTVRGARDTVDANDDGLELPGRGIAPGLAFGPAARRDARGSIVGAVWVAERASPDDVDAILSSAGCITVSGSLLSHVALLCREFGRPAVAIGRAGAAFPPHGPIALQPLETRHGSDSPIEQGDIVWIDGERGTVRVPGRSASARRAVRRVFEPLFESPGDPEKAVARSLRAVRDLGDASPQLLERLVEAIVVYRETRDPDRVDLLRAMRREASRHDSTRIALDRAVANVARAVVVRLRDRSEVARRAILHAKATDDVDRQLERFKADGDRFATALEAAGFRGSTATVASEMAAELDRSGAERSDALRRAAHGDIREALRIGDDGFERRIGGMIALARRASAAGVGREAVEELRARTRDCIAARRSRLGEPLTLPLDEGSETARRAIVGGKALGLIDALPILPSDCRVPPGFVITTSAYRLHLLGETGEALHRAVSEHTDPDALSRAARAAVLAGPVVPDVEAAISEALEGAGLRGALAVRSSATVEDGPSGSLAGQFDSVLGVRARPELLRRVRWAWASLWNARAIRTLAATGRTPLESGIAVIVQECVETRTAGVLFTRDPSGASDGIVINAWWGIGEGVSQGDVSGELYRIDRSGRLLEHAPSDELRAIRLDDVGPGTVEVELPADRHRVRCLSDRDLARLAKLATALENDTGRARDVEFGFDASGRLVLFQVRRLARRLRGF